MIWKQKTEKYSNGFTLKCGNIQVGDINWNSSRSQRDPEAKNYRGSCIFDPKVLYGETAEELQREITELVRAHVCAMYVDLEDISTR